jgi:hypothetical protein
MIVALPGATPVAVPPLLTVTMPIALDDQPTNDVQSVLEPSEYVQAAVYCWVAKAGNEVAEGATVMVCRVGDELLPTVILPEPDAANTSTPAVSVVALVGAPAPEMA